MAKSYRYLQPKAEQKEINESF